MEKETIHLFKCSCEESKEEYERKDFMVHLKKKHGVDVKTIKGKKQMIMHMDGSNWYSSTL